MGAANIASKSGTQRCAPGRNSTYLVLRNVSGLAAAQFYVKKTSFIYVFTTETGST